jgi:divalent metal cation (Fe/Co/Zn/Cd) transporter
MYDLAGKKKLDQKKLWNVALLLAVVTVFYNIIEGLVSVGFGISDESLALFGFGLDSFIEVMSGIGVWHMIIRIRNRGIENRDRFERTALRITGIAFLILAGGLAVTVAINLYSGHRPETTFWGIVVSLISILTMTLLVILKLNAGKKLNSAAVVADANCTKTCLILSIILLISSGLYEIFKIGYFDSLGALGIAFYAFMEGRESLEKSKGRTCNCL